MLNIISFWEDVLQPLQIFGIVLDSFEQAIRRGLFFSLQLNISLVVLLHQWIAEQFIDVWSFFGVKLEQRAYNVL